MNAAATITTKQRIKRVIFFFPFQLFMLHVKKNHFLLFFWVLIFGVTMRWFGTKYGIDHQFLFPEYLGTIGPLSFALFGFALGGFILAFNLYTYILHGFRFPFIATLSRPFAKFSINNFIIPALYVICYLWKTIDYQLHEEFLSGVQISLNLLGFGVGVFLFLIISSLYFVLTNKNAGSYATSPKPRIKYKQTQKSEGFVNSPIHQGFRWFSSGRKYRRWQVETYMLSFWRIGLARQSLHYDKDLLKKVFAQNHINASIFEIFLIGSFILIGSFREHASFVIPAAASVLLFFTIMLMVISALFSWIKGWTITVFVALFIGINYSFPGSEFLNVPNHAYGLDYTQEPATYDHAFLESINDQDSLVQADFDNMLIILDNWRKKQLSKTMATGELPKLVIINTSGGGLRSAMWTMQSLLVADSIVDGELMDNTFLMTGSSGGMIGAAYLRELYFKRDLGLSVDPADSRFRDNMSKDLLNPVIFSIATNDFFIRYQKFKEGDNIYTKDRGYSFEKQLNQNTGYFLDKRLGDYQKPEMLAQMPLVIMAPSIINDGRRLLISAQPISFLTQNKPGLGIHNKSVAEDVEFTRFFAKQNASNLRFTSALRMNATFPYVLPVVSLPSDPPVEVMDAGLRDNYGMKTTLQFLYTFRNWINTNTSGVIILQVRDIPKDKATTRGGQTLVQEFTAPLGTVYGNVTRIQDYTHDQMIRYMTGWFERDVDIIDFTLPHEQNTAVSLSWHLTQAEKSHIQNGTVSGDYLRSVAALDSLLNK
jgi:hypothetical protein